MTRIHLFTLGLAVWSLYRLGVPMIDPLPGAEWDLRPGLHLLIAVWGVGLVIWWLWIRRGPRD